MIKITKLEIGLRNKIEELRFVKLPLLAEIECLLLKQSFSFCQYHKTFVEILCKSVRLLITLFLLIEMILFSLGRGTFNLT